jgi:hypothetical protein
MPEIEPEPEPRVEAGQQYDSLCPHLTCEVVTFSFRTLRRVEVGQHCDSLRGGDVHRGNDREIAGPWEGLKPQATMAVARTASWAEARACAVPWLMFEQAAGKTVCGLNAAKERGLDRLK